MSAAATNGSAALCAVWCGNGGVCIDGACLCPTGWVGSDCSERSILALPSFLLVLGFLFIVIASWTIGKETRRLRLPLITVYILVGVAAGPHALDLVPVDEVRRLDLVDKVALAFIAFAAGAKLYIDDLKRSARTIAWVTTGLVLAENVLGTLVCFAVAGTLAFMTGMGTNERWAVSLLVGSLLTARSPATALAVTDELSASGPFTRVVLGVTVVSDVVVIVVFSVVMLIVSATFDADGKGDDGKTVFGISLLRIFLSVLLGSLCGLLLPRLIFGWARPLCFPLTHARARLVRAVQFLLLAGVSVAVFVLDHFEESYVEPLLLTMSAGFVACNFTNKRAQVTSLLHDCSPTIYVFFFTLVGASLALDTLGSVIAIALLFVVVRLLGIFLGAYLGGRAARDRHVRVSWAAYVTQAGVSLGLAKKVHSTYPEWGGDFATLVVAIVCVNQIIGPPLLKYALRTVREDGKVKPTGMSCVVFGDEDDHDVGKVRYCLEQKGWDVCVESGDSHRPSTEEEEAKERLVTVVGDDDDDDGDDRKAEDAAVEAFRIPFDSNVSAVVIINRDEDVVYAVSVFVAQVVPMARVVVLRDGEDPRLVPHDSNRNGGRRESPLRLRNGHVLPPRTRVVFRSSATAFTVAQHIVTGDVVPTMHRTVSNEEEEEDGGGRVKERVGAGEVEMEEI